MISIIIVLFNYFIWLFTGYVPMKHLAETPMVCIPLTILEVVAEMVLFYLFGNLFIFYQENEREIKQWLERKNK